MVIEVNQPLMSYDDYMRLPEQPYGEVIDGVFLVTPSPSFWHQELGIYIGGEIRNWLRAHPGQGRVALAPIDVVLRPERPARIVQPDVVFVSAERAHLIQRVVHGAPDLVVEVVSPTSASRDAIKKRSYYTEYGVREYWLVWPDEARIDVLAEGQEPREVVAGEFLETPLMPGLRIDVADLFREPT